jgi:hypothetical protein
VMMTRCDALVSNEGVRTFVDENRESDSRE